MLTRKSEILDDGMLLSYSSAHLLNAGSVQRKEHVVPSQKQLYIHFHHTGDRFPRVNAVGCPRCTGSLPQSLYKTPLCGKVPGFGVI